MNQKRGRCDDIHTVTKKVARCGGLGVIDRILPSLSMAKCSESSEMLECWVWYGEKLVFWVFSEVSGKKHCCEKFSLSPSFYLFSHKSKSNVSYPIPIQSLYPYIQEKFISFPLHCHAKDRRQMFFNSLFPPSLSLPLARNMRYEMICAPGRLQHSRF